MRALSLPAVVLAALATPALAIDIVELKDGRVLEVEEMSVRGDRLRVRLHTGRPDQTVAYTIPLEKVVPEFVFYAWAKGLDPTDVDAQMELARWARDQGLFVHAWNTYEATAAHSGELEERLPALRAEMHEEEATWHFREAERHFRDNAVAEARHHAEKVLEHFADTDEVGRSKALLNIIAEREQFLSEQKRQEEIAARARRQKRIVDRHIERIEKADAYVLKARLDRPVYAERRLAWAAFAYRDAALEFADLLPLVEVDDLRLTVEALLADLQERMVRTFGRLADLRWVGGDAHGALDAVHEVLTLDPDNKAATGLRERILDGGAPPEPERVYDPVFRYRLIGLRRHAYPVPYRGLHRGFGLCSRISVYGIHVGRSSYLRYVGLR